MNFLRTKTFIGILCFILGALAMFTAQRLTSESRIGFLGSLIHHEKATDPFFDLAFDHDSFGDTQNAFEEMKRLREKMMNLNEEESKGLFDSWFKKRSGSNAITEIREKEDQNSISYEISIAGLKQEKVNVTVENGQIRISGETEQKTQNGDTNSIFTSSFHRSFPVPSNVNVENPQIHQEKNKLIVKFSKLTPNGP